MRLFNSGDFWLFNILLIAVNFAISSGAEPCHEMDSGSSWKDCVYNSSIDYVGNRQEEATINLGYGTEDEIKAFFSQFKPGTTLVSRIQLARNDVIESIDFGPNIVKWEGFPDSNSVFIVIRDNSKLKELKAPGLSAPAQIWFYNNPLFDPNTISTILSKQAKGSYVQKELGECIFQRPYSLTVYNHPVQDFLDLCKIIRGDAILENRTISQEVTIEGKGCLNLTNVDMTHGKLKIKHPASVVKNCVVERIFPMYYNKDFQSAIIKNPGLCGDDLTELEGFFVNSSEIPIEIDIPSCTFPSCNDVDALHKYLICKEINATVDIGSWFTDPKLKNKKDYLISATESLMVENSQLSALSLPKLDTVNELVISGNSNLTTIDLPNLKTVTSLTITDCTLLTNLSLPNLTTIAVELTISGNSKLTTINIPNLKLDTIKIVKITGNRLLGPDKFDKFNFTVNHLTRIECYTDDSISIKNIAELNGCTVVKGPLKLEGPMVNVTPGAFHVREIEGCLTIRGTALTNLDFLDQTTLRHCTGRYSIYHNKVLCTPEWLQKKGDLVKSGNEPCEKTCSSIDELMQGELCVIFDGDLNIFNDTVTDNRLVELKTIRGQLFIGGTSRVVMPFPNLEEISTTGDTALRIENNKNLMRLPMPKIPKMSSKGTPFIIVRENHKMLEVEEFLTEAQIYACKWSIHVPCYYDWRYYERHPERAPPFYMETWFLLPAIVNSSLIVYGVSLYVVMCWCCAETEEEDEDEDEEEMLEMAATRDETVLYTAEGLPRSPTNTGKTYKTKKTKKTKKSMRRKKSVGSTIMDLVTGTMTDEVSSDVVTVEEQSTDGGKSVDTTTGGGTTTDDGTTDEETAHEKTAEEEKDKTASMPRSAPNKVTKSVKTKSASLSVKKGTGETAAQVTYPSIFLRHVAEQKGKDIGNPENFKALCEHLLSRDPLYYRQKFLSGKAKKAYPSFSFLKNVHFIVNKNTSYMPAFFDILAQNNVRNAEATVAAEQKEKNKRDESLLLPILSIGGDFAGSFDYGMVGADEEENKEENEKENEKENENERKEQIKHLKKVKAAIAKKDQTKILFDFDDKIPNLTKPKVTRILTRYVAKLDLGTMKRVTFVTRYTACSYLEVTQAEVPDRIKGAIAVAVADIPFYEYLHTAWQKNIPVHTEVPEYFTAIYLFYYTLDKMKKGDEPLAEDFVEEMYTRIQQAYCPEIEMVDSFYLWYYATLKRMVTDEQLLTKMYKTKQIKAIMVDRAKKQMTAIEEMDERVNMADNEVKWGMVEGKEFIEIVSRYCLPTVISGFYQPKENLPGHLINKAVEITADQLPKGFQAVEQTVAEAEKKKDPRKMATARKMPSKGAEPRKIPSREAGPRKMPSTGAGPRKMPSNEQKVPRKMATAVPKAAGPRHIPSAGQRTAEEA